MKKILFALLVLLLPTLAHAAYDDMWYAGRKWDPATARFLEDRASRVVIPMYQPSPLGSFLLEAAAIGKSAPIDKANLPANLGLATFEVSKYAGRAPVLLRRGVAIMGPVGAVVTAAMTAKEVYDWAHEDDTNKAYFDGIAPAIPGFNSTTGVGSVGTWQGETYSVTSINNSGTTAYGPAGVTCTTYQSVPYRCDQMMIKWSIASYFGYKSVNLTKIQTPPPPNAMSSDENWWYNELDKGLADPSLYPNMQKGIDKALESRLNNPAKVQTSLTAAEMIAGKAAAESTAAKEQVAETVQQQYSAAKVRLAAGGGSQAEVDELKRITDALAAEKAAQEAADAEDAAVATSSSQPDELKQIDWTPFLQLQGVLVTKFPFSLLAGLVNAVQGLSQTPTAPTFDFPLPFDTVIHVDLAVFDPVASVARWVGGFLLTIGMIWLINKFWRGVS